MPNQSFLPKSLVVLIYALAGWALCGATMGIGLAATTLRNAIAIHAVAAPIIFSIISYFYFRRRDPWPPLRAAVAFIAIILAMDLLVVSLLIKRNFDMFGSIFGTWLPFFLIFVSSWWTGLAVRRSVRYIKRLD